MAHLARLEFEESAADAMVLSMSEILDWVEKLQEINTEGVEPLTHMSYEINAWREDETGEMLPREDALRNAPQHDDQHFRVPKVL